MHDAMTAQSTDGNANRARRIALILLIVVYTLNFVDRQILSILKEPIAADLHLSDTDLGLLGGFAFALFYSLLAIPFAWLADRFSRVWIISAGLFLWSGFTAHVRHGGQLRRCCSWRAWAWASAKPAASLRHTA